MGAGASFADDESSIPLLKRATRFGMDVFRAGSYARPPVSERARNRNPTIPRAR